MSDDKSLEGILSPEDVAELSESADAILAHPVPSEADLARLKELQDGSDDRVEAMAMDGRLDFDLTTQQGHIDAVTFLQTYLLSTAHRIQGSEDQIELNELFSGMHVRWNEMPEMVQFNAVLNLLGIIVGLKARQDSGTDD